MSTWVKVLESWLWNHEDSQVRDKKENELQLPAIGMASWISTPKKILTLESSLVREELYMEEHILAFQAKSFHSYFMNRLTWVRAYQRSEAKTQSIKQRK